MSRDIFDVLEGGEVVGLNRDFGLIAVWNRSLMVSMWMGEREWTEADVVTMGGEPSRQEAERIAERMIAEFLQAAAEEP